jgi:hypothetical protein
MDPLDELLFVLTLVEGAACLAFAFMAVLVAPYSLHDQRLIAHLAMFGIAALALLMTAALGDCYHRARHHRSQQ